MTTRASLRLLGALALTLPAGPAWAVLTITPITWDVIGLDSNKPSTDGPDTFPVGARVCNVSGSATGTVTASFVRDGATNPYIATVGPTTHTWPSLPAGGTPPSPYSITTTPSNCFDFYFQVQLSRTAAAHNTTQAYRITATDGASTVSTPAGRQLFVEKLISQGRNAVNVFSGPPTVYVGEYIDYTVTGYTAVGGYEQVEFAPVLPYMFQLIQDRITSMAVPSGAVNSTVYADACGWEPDPSHPDYWRKTPSDECHNPDGYAGGKAGGNPVSMTYTVKALTAGSGQMTNVWYDFSGSSFHYNSDVGSGVNAINVTVVPPSAPAVTKSFSPSTIPVNGTAVMTITFTNTNPALSGVSAPPIRGLAFTDAYPAGIVNDAVPNATTTCTSAFPDPPTTVTAAGGGASLALANGTVPPLSSCTVTVTVRNAASTDATVAAGAGVYTNSTGPVSTTYAGTAAAASGVLRVIGGYKSVRLATDADGSGSVTPGDTLRWSVFYHNPAGGTPIADFQVTDALASGMTASGAPVVSYAPAACAAGTANAAYDGGGTTALFASAFTLNAGCTVRVDFSATVAAGLAGGTVLGNQASATGTGLAATLTDDIDATTTGLPAGVSPAGDSIAQTQNDPSLDAASATVQPTADLSITKSDGRPAAGRGETLTYTIVASNAGPDGVTNATVSDTFNAATYDVASITWTCAVTAGSGDCEITSPGSGASGTGNIDLNRVQLASGASITVTVTAPLAAAFTGTASNTATIATPPGRFDPVSANNGATDTTVVNPPITVVKSSSVVSDPVHGGVNPKRIPGAVVQYTLVVDNSGGGAPVDAVIAIDVVPAATTYVPGSLVVDGVAEDDDAAGADETDPDGADYGVSAAGTVTVRIAAIPAGGSKSVVFRVAVD